ncbi:ef798fcc-f04c-4c85-91f9-df14b1c280cd [Thermothielavioides terrestris]|uniref:Ef798fcc-f04c-4c85-91f9-df14b1c280cd n=1 Tax=Thermothielavioides terrestris TaxID=2587410 RepID=A0A3S4CAH4_9PEZI|nr:ef798fcc-f04c-4c85-91f9-df14b1c280cd [Thermothielavioides terrestris]
MDLTNLLVTIALMDERLSDVLAYLWRDPNPRTLPLWTSLPSESASDRLGGNLQRANVAALCPPLLPRVDIAVVDPVAVQAQLQLQRQMDHRQRALGQVLRVEDDHVVAQLVEVVQQRDQVALALGAALARDEGRLLEGHGRPGEVDVLQAELALQVALLGRAVLHRPAGVVVLLGPGGPHFSKSYGRDGSTTACQKWRYGLVTKRSSMRENSPLVSQVSAGFTRSSATHTSASPAPGVRMADFFALGSNTQRTVGEVKRLRLAKPSGGVTFSSGGNQKNTLPSATVRSKTTSPDGSS